LVFAVVIPKLFGAKIILDIHDSLPQTFLSKYNLTKKNFIYKLLILEERMSYRFSDKVIAAHSLLKDEVFANVGLDVNKFDVILNYADELIFNFIEEYKLNGKLRLVFHGTIAERFGLDYVLDELKDLDDVDFDFTIIGEGDYSAEIENKIKACNLASKVKFINKYYPVKELPKILSDFNLGLVSYEISQATEYMLPVKLFELISMGIPAIVVKNKVIYHYFIAEDVFFYENSLPGSLKKLVKNISKNKNLLLEKRKRLSEIREKYYWSYQAQKYYDIVQNLIGANN